MLWSRFQSLLSSFVFFCFPQVRYFGVSNETSFGVMSFEMARLELKNQGIDVPKMVSIQNSYSLLVRSAFETDLAETCSEANCNIGLLAYSPLAGGALSGKYLDVRTVDVVVKARVYFSFMCLCVLCFGREPTFGAELQCKRWREKVDNG